MNKRMHLEMSHSLMNSICVCLVYEELEIEQRHVRH